MSGLNWLFVDLNSYFASVEQQIEPRLRHKPIAVLPVMAETTGVIAASYEAKRCGIKTNTKVFEARKLCPDIIFVPARHEAYVEYHHKILQAVENCLPISAILSIDEMACKLMGREREKENAILLGKKVKQSILQNAGEYLHCSVGLAANRFLGKVASDMQKPNGLTVIENHELPEKLLSLKLRDFPGIGPNMEKRLLLRGINSTEKMLALSQLEMREIWGGIGGEYFWAWLRGEETESKATKKSSIGHSHVLPPEYRNREDAYLVLQKLLHKAAARLRKVDYWCTHLSLSVRYSDRDEKFEESVSFLECRDDLTLVEAMQSLWRQAPRFGKPLKVGVTLSGLIEGSHHTLSLFRNPRREELSTALDLINNKFGKNTLSFASLQKMEDAAPTRIAFTNIPDFDV